MDVFLRVNCLDGPEPLSEVGSGRLVDQHVHYTLIYFLIVNLLLSPELFVQMTLFHCLVSRPQQRGKRQPVRGWHSTTYVGGPYQLRLVFAIC